MNQVIRIIFDDNIPRAFVDLILSGEIGVDINTLKQYILIIEVLLTWKKLH